MKQTCATGLLLSFTLLPITFPAASPGTASTGVPVYYNATRVEAARANIERYEWAREMRDQAVRRAEDYLDEIGGDAAALTRLWDTVTPQSIIRVSGMGSNSNPRTGKGADWSADPFNEPWKVIDRNTGDRFPSNDFGAYYRSGLDDRGLFEPELADRSLLVNDLYPDKPRDWGVDDGYGWTDEKGTTWRFIGWYNGRELWQRRIWTSIFQAMMDAYLFTGDGRYARVGLVLLDRIADVYAELDHGDQPGGIRHTAATGQGKVMGSIGEGYRTYFPIMAFDAFRGHLEDDPELVALIGRLSGRYPGLPRRDSAEEIRRHILDGFIQETLQGVKDAQIRGNFGHHQRVLAASILVADDPEYGEEAMDFLLRGGGLSSRDGRHAITGAELMSRLVGHVDRDGHNFESVHYNHIPWAHINTTAELLSQYKHYDGADLLRNVKLMKMNEAMIPLIALDRYLPHIGNTYVSGNDIQDRYNRADRLAWAYEIWGDPVFAQAAYLHNGNTTEGLHGDIFSPDAGSVARRIQEAIAEHGPLQLSSSHLAGYGLAILRDGETDTQGMDWRRALWLFYGRSGIVSHNHRDSLNLGLFAHRLNLLYDLGYPERTGNWARRMNWTDNTISHNTVLVDDRKQRPQWVANPRHFDHTDRVQLIDVESPRAYPQTELYRRTVAMIRVDEQDFYAVDLFWVHGGEEHLYSFHAAEGAVTTAGLTLVPQPRGTYATPEIDLPGPGQWTDYDRETGNGYNYLVNVERDFRPGERFSVDWKIADTWNVYNGEDPNVNVRLTMLGDFSEVALADGSPPKRGQNPERIKYVLARRSGENLQTVFTSVIEAYQGNRAVRSIELLPVSGAASGRAQALKVELENGRTDCIAANLDPGRPVTVVGAFRFDGFFAVYSERQDRPEFAYLIGGRALQALTGDQRLVSVSDPYLRGSLRDFTRDLSFENELVVQIDGTANFAPAELAGRWIYIETDGERNGAYEIRAAERLPDGLWRLDIGDVTTVRELADEQNPRGGYRFNIREGQPFRIPFSATRSDTSRASLPAPE